MGCCGQHVAPARHKKRLKRPMRRFGSQASCTARFFTLYTIEGGPTLRILSSGPATSRKKKKKDTALQLLWGTVQCGKISSLCTAAKLNLKEDPLSWVPGVGSRTNVGCAANLAETRLATVGRTRSSSLACGKWLRSRIIVDRTDLWLSGTPRLQWQASCLLYLVYEAHGFPLASSTTCWAFSRK